ncbi:MAG: TetR/AcrR family transcriptional regulator [Hahellaceae bacterium]|nr:TetR/AcrR family transcriptional regulator [Hahellaceae bacterium]
MDTVNIEGRAYHHGDLKPSLLEVALQVLDTEGLEAVSIRRLARELGVAHSAPANHFATRKDLLTGMAEVCFDELSLGSAACPDDVGCPRDESALKALYRATLNYGLRYPNRYRMMFRWGDLNAEDTGLQTRIEILYRRLMQCMASTGGDTPLFSNETRAIALWSMLHGYMVMRIEGTIQGGFHDEINGMPREEALFALLTHLTSEPTGFAG